MSDKTNKPQTMIETVARALQQSFSGDLRDWDSQPEDGKQQWRACARAAIEAMREPTGIQIDAALAGDEHWSMNAIPRIRRAYRRMIDAALKELP